MRLFLLASELGTGIPLDAQGFLHTANEAGRGAFAVAIFGNFAGFAN
jgi:hypothetical protein